MGLKDPKWEIIWKWRGPERIQVFLWQLMQDRLHTNEIRYKKWGASGNCAVRRDLELVMHVMRDYKVARNLWGSFSMMLPNRFCTADREGWLIMNLKSKQVIRSIPWPIIFGIVCWSI